ncbi:MAG: copper oxidase [Tagaea sp. CACIAM 22H2]|nr:copper oxidase [Tagaea sp. CACIAM 22H2]
MGAGSIERPGRCRFLAGAASVSLFPGFVSRANAQARALPIPRLVDSTAGPIRLEVAGATHAFGTFRPSPTMGYSSTYLGPTLLFRNGCAADVEIRNLLDEPTSTHFHGFLIPAAADGSPHHPIAPGTMWRTSFRVAQPAATAWYHAHPHGATGRQVYSGLAGLAIVEDLDARRHGLPATYGIDDLPLILQDRAFDAEGRLVYLNRGPAMMMGMRGATFVVNGVVDPVARVPAGLVRLRILNAANARNFDLAFDDGRPFAAIATDGGYLREPAQLRSLVVAPGERVEVVVDFSSGLGVRLETGSDTTAALAGRLPISGRIMGRGSGPLLRFEVDRALPAQGRLPDRLRELATVHVRPELVRRTLSLDMGTSMMRGSSEHGGAHASPFGINGKPFDPNRIDFEPRLGGDEIWDIAPQMMSHPFHVHGAMFRILEIDGEPPPAHLAGEKDTVLATGPTKLLVSFRQPATTEHPFMFHCHVLEHEDAGMMGQYRTI